MSVSDDAATDEADAPEFEPAARYLEASLVPRQGTRAQKALRSLATIAAGLMTGDLEAGPSATDLRVVRRDTGGEVLRVSAGTVAESDLLLARVRRDLATMGVMDFVQQWRQVAPEKPAHVDDAAAPGDPA